MMLLSNLRIRSRLLILLVFSVLALVGLGAFSSMTIMAEADRSTAFIDTEFESVRALGEVRRAVDASRRHEKDIFLTMGDEKEGERYTALWVAEIARVRDAISRTQGLVQPSEAAQLAQLQHHFDNYVRGFTVILGQLARGELNDPWAASAALAPFANDLGQVDQAVADLSASIAARAVARREGLAHTAAQAPWLVAAATVVVALLATVLVLAIVRSILAPIRELQRTAGAWGQGDLSVRVDAQGRCELSDVQRDLGRMHHSLAGLVSQVHSGVGVVSGNTHEIASANHQLADRTERAAIALQKIVASVDALALAARQTAHASASAVHMTDTASEVAQRGGAEIAQVIQTMRKIDTASHRIADIIGVIDGIAFQTNILALNASVEAARAGDQGRGFAVVAAEVRSLAGRCAQAAREIKGIIGDSVGAVQQGSALVDNAGGTMRDIVACVGRLSTTIREIGTAAHEQLQGIDQIHEAMGGVDQATQQNAAMVEESAAGASSLAQETEHLRRAVAVFKLEDGGQNSWPNEHLALANYA